ncbi:TPA: hypothetical protein PXJ53_000160 [Yersinia enterocolitica]|uniref:hypothetical protein n=1 Tax=Yersinia enterocolitica TaxID=630 RepID=UPI002866BC56|nr:hypothetical protein [Yersinia enterocolitica]EKN6360964.1 hypothetical protein [Yersinia enterocolitica]ELZ3993606.1 hypothetical protein [Yersinia enterocolitica]HDL6631995.1 hypothetical protein [Yersinia enterocolitica]HDL6641282.1 hypothetical protein [Yersinia enterocolitica]
MESRTIDSYLNELDFLLSNELIDVKSHERLISYLRNDNLKMVDIFINEIKELHRLNSNGKEDLIFDIETSEKDKLSYAKDASELKHENRRLNQNLRKTKEWTINLEKMISDITEKCNTLVQEKDTLINEKDSIIEEKNILIKENKELKELSQQKIIDKEIPGYVQKVSEKLDKDDLFFTEMSRNWSITGIVVTLFAVFAAFCTFSQGTDLILKNENFEWVGLLYIFIRGGLGIGLLSWLAFVCFSNSRNYTHESIRRKDRQHALSFGQLFLQIYGSSATKEDAMLVFKDWNMSGDSAFSKAADTPPNIIEILKSLISSTNRNKGSNNEAK